MIEFGKCMLCQKPIASKCGECGTLKPNSEYTEVEVQWSNDSKMKIGVCLDCAKNNKHATAHAKQQLTQAHHDHWDQEGHAHDKGVVLV